ncbi:ARID DNA-binding domain-containing protein [Tanacetum coccineum]|uniref:ARID DNA-binding domain-containing protein n=1 Tax=Tanacetum coccineum TaxID=301880 RepID=A0ABQ5AQ63_9ASTR
MVNHNYVMKNNRLQHKSVQHWYQSHGTENGVKPNHNRHDQEGVTRGYLLRETPQRLLSWRNRKKSLSPGCKEMLLEKMKEIEAFNASRVSANTSTQKEKRARCYICKERGHVFWKCPNKQKKALFKKHKGIMKPTFKKVAEKVKYLEKVHVITCYMIEGTSDATWNEIWYVSSAYKQHMCQTRSLFRKLKYKFEMIGKEETEKKFIFSYGIGDIIMEAKEGNFVIPNVHYTPEYMFGGKGKGKAHEGSYTDNDGLEHVITEHNKFLDKYFKSIEPKDEGSCVKGLKKLKLEEIPPRVGVMEINLLGLHKMVDNLGGYLSVTLGDKWNTIASLQGLTNEDGEAMKDCYRKFIDMVQVKDPQGKEKDEAGKEEALEKDKNKSTQFGVRLESNEEEAEEGSVTDSNDFEVIV